MHPLNRQELTSPPLSLKFSKEVQAELSFWEQFRFSFDMGNDSSNGSSNPSPTQRACSVSPSSSRGPGEDHDIDAQDAVLLGQFAAGAGMSSYNSSHTNSIESLLAQGAYPSSSELNDNPFKHGDTTHTHTHTQSPPLSSSDFPWDPFLSRYQGHQTYLDQISPMQRDGSTASSSSHPYDGLSLILHNANPPENPGSLSRHSSTSATVVGSASTAESTSEPSPTTTEFDRTLTAEEKRRRNTEASARFRVKRKQRTLNLERTVNDLTGRAEDLKRQAADLRRENGWLKEIVILKGSQRAVTNLASRIMAESTHRAVEGSLSKEEDESSESSDPEGASTSKRKGKSRRK